MIAGKASFNLSQVVQQHRLMLWILLLVLTAVLLFFPIHLSYEYHAVESIFVFGDRLPLFGVLFYLWLGILLLFLFTGGKTHEWRSLALVCLFSLVFFGFWAINTPFGSHWDELWNMGHVKYLQQTGHLAPLHPNLSYFQFPSLYLTAFSISDICGLDIFIVRTLFIIFSSTLFAAFSYLFFGKLLKDSRLSCLAVLLIIISLVSTRDFWPGNLGVLSLILILALISWREDALIARGTNLTFIMIILLAAFIITYLPASSCFVFILVGIYLLQKITKQDILVWSTIALFVVLFLVWEMYYATALFGGLVGFGPAFIAGITDPLGRWFSGSAVLVTPAFGDAIPLWAKSTKFLIVALTMGFGAILGFWNLIRFRKLSFVEVLETGGLLGVITFLIICFLATPGIDQGFRALMYFPFFTIPIMIRFMTGFNTRNRLSLPDTILDGQEEKLKYKRAGKRFLGLGPWFRQHTFALMIVLFFILSLPAFLVDKAEVSTTAVYPYECSAGSFIESAYNGQDLAVFCDVYKRIAYPFYVPQAHFESTLPATTKETLLLDMNNLIGGFQNSVPESAVFILSEKLRQPSHQPAIVEPSDPGWLGAVGRLEENNRIYDNGRIEIYKR